MKKDNQDIVAMIADDQSLMRDLLDSTLQTLEIKTIIHAKNAETAIKLFKSKKPDIVFLDINMPDMNGLEVLKIMISIDENIFVTILSGENTVTNVKNAIAYGAQGFIVKPYTQDKIESIIKKFITTKLVT